MACTLTTLIIQLKRCSIKPLNTVSASTVRTTRTPFPNSQRFLPASFLRRCDDNHHHHHSRLPLGGRWVVAVCRAGLQLAAPFPRLSCYFLPPSTPLPSPPPSPPLPTPLPRFAFPLSPHPIPVFRRRVLYVTIHSPLSFL